MTNKVYQIITDKILEQLEAGVVPWKKGWVGGLPVNYFSQRPYSGVNLLLLEGGAEYCTWNQLQRYNLDMELSGHPEKIATVVKGSHYYPVIFFAIYDPSKNKRKGNAVAKKPETQTGKEKKEKKLILRFYKVYNINDIDGLESKRIKYEGDPVEEAERIINEYTEVPIEHKDLKQAYYSPAFDRINVPPRECFPAIARYYATTFHEMGHSTGHETRLKRFEHGCGGGIFGSKSYSFEELVAEITAAFLCGHCRIDTETLEYSASYIESWMKVLREDSRIIISASGKASASADYIRKVKDEEEKEIEQEVQETEEQAGIPA